MESLLIFGSIVAGWFFCGWLGYGFYMAQAKRYPILFTENSVNTKKEALERWNNRRYEGITNFMFGPIALLSAIIVFEISSFDLSYLTRWNSPFIEVK